MRKPMFCICEKKDADQLDPPPPPPRNFKPLAIFCSCTVWFVSNMVGNPEDRFSHDEAHIAFEDGYRVEILDIGTKVRLGTDCTSPSNRTKEK